MNKAKLISFICLFVLFSCNQYWEYQEKYLLPSSYKLEKIDAKKIGITTYNFYKIIGEINTDSIKHFPKYAMKDRGWSIDKWHKASFQEFKNLKSFFEEESPFIDKEALNKILKSIEQESNYLIASANDNDRPSLKMKDYLVGSWMEFYFLDLDKNELIHISYGEF